MSDPPQEIRETIAAVLLGRSLPEKTLRIGLLAPSTALPEWACDVAAAVDAAPRLDLAVVILTGAPRNSSAGLSQSLFELYRAKTSRGGMEQPADLRGRLKPLEGFCEAAAGEWARVAETRNLDVLLYLGNGEPPPESCRGAARYGVWSMLWDAAGEPRIEPAYFRQVAGREEVSAATLLVHSDSLAKGRVLHEYFAATQSSLDYTRNTLDPMRTAKRLILRRLYDLLERGWEWIEGREEYRRGIVSVETRRDYPGPPRLGLFVLDRIGLSIRGRLQNSRSAGTWFIAYRDDPRAFTACRKSFDTAGFRELPPAGKGFGAADPFVVSHEGRDWLFAEEIPPHGRGRLVVYESDARGWLADRPTVILEAGHHLSYPCIVRDRGEFFMIPETSEAARVELYRATRFPYEWTREAVLADGVRLVDTTPWRHNGHWYFFTTVTHGAIGMEALLFRSDTLDGRWTAHPANPISSDARNSRMAGMLFERQGSLIRPAQDCTGSYGRAIRLNRIERLTPSEYHERTVETIEPSWHPRSERTHTLNAGGRWEVIDGWKRMPLPQ
jgi:hypothetical protein